MREPLQTQILRIAGVLDSQGKTDAPITVMAARATLRPIFKARERGGPLFHENHELRLVADAGKCPSTMPLFTDEGRATAEARA